MKLEQIEKTKLLQYKITKSKRLEDLEGKAREFEVLSNLNLPRMIGLLESKDEQISYLKTRDKLNEAHLISS
jgi:mannose/fructose-specific phosphotransferase system component IIA